MAFFAFMMIGTHNLSHPPEMGGRHACTSRVPGGRHQRLAFIAFAFIAFIALAFIAMAFMAFIAFAMI